MWTNNRLLDLFGIDLPIIQAPMAGSNGADMAIAVSEAGGLGSLPCAPLDASAVREALQAISRVTSKPINANFFAHLPPAPDRHSDHRWLSRLKGYYKELSIDPPERLSAGPIHHFDDALCRVIEERLPAVVSFHFGLPEQNLIRRIKSAGAKIMSSATTPKEARWLVDHGCDVVIAQGSDAGGHRGMFLTTDIATQMGTLSLVPQIVDAVDVPVVAAGGIADGRGMAAALTLGAAGVQVGTAYLLTDEATISDTYRRTVSKAKDLPTSITNVFSGRPSRCVVNRLVEEIGPLADDAPAFPAGFTAISPLRARAEEMGRRDFSAHFCGQAVALCRPTNARDLTRTLCDDAQDRLVQMHAPI